ncbi:MAG TPA: zinc-dependent metalloprotease, partial [Puia sp.]|nr:zinc-dependent metalloprotease [Puia sp.]
EGHSSGGGAEAIDRVGTGGGSVGGNEKGLFEVRKKDDRYLFELPDNLLGRDMLVVSRIAKGAAGSRAYSIGYAGDQINYNVIRFERGPVGKMYMLAPSWSELASDSSANGMARAVTESNGTPILLTLDIKPGQDSGRGVTSVDVTDLLNGDNDIFFFEQGTRRALGLGGLAAERSSVVSTRSFPMNVEIRTMKTYTKASDASLYSGGGGSAGSEAATFLLNTSVVLLPAVPMRPRYADKRVGYFSIDHTDYDANPQGVKKISMAIRWRLEPKAEDSAKYMRGELVEPRQPIVYYIDRATPAKWVPYLIQGVEDWGGAFEKAGFKNAIMAKMAPADDSSWSMDDARHNVIVYKPSEVANATSPQIHDPRSGEIIETHVNWYHNIMSLLHSWYMIQTAAVDPRARHMTFDDSLMGELIRFVSSHEIGHTLGLEHNFGASATMPVELLRDTAFLRVYGHSPSIMDYARFNYVAQPEDHIPENLLFPRIGEYDRFAIEWGYRWRPEFSSPAEEAIAIGREVGLKVDRNVRLWYGPENSLKDPRCQSEDLGDNAMVASTYGIKNLKRIALGLPEWTKEPNGDYENLHNMYSEVTAQYNRYIGHVLRNIGSTMTTWRTTDQPGAVNGDVPGWKQQEAIRFLLDEVFTTPTWMVDYLTADSRISESSRVDVQFTLGGAQQQAINRVLSFDVLSHLARVREKGYTAGKLLEELSGGVFSELRPGLAVDVYRRNVQKMYVDQLV